MKAVLSMSTSGPEALVLGEIDRPSLKPGHLLIRVHACAVNYPDVLIVQDKYQFKPTRPFSPGCEAAGEIVAIGDGVDGWKVGDRVLGTAIHGGMAQYMLLDAVNTFPLPDSRSFIEGAALVQTYGTSFHGLFDRGHLKRGDTLLVLGAAGGVGIAAIELGKAFGARVVGAVSSEEKAAAVRSAGADDVLIYDRARLDRDASRALADRFKALVGKDGANVIYDPVGGDYAEAALRSIAWEGRYLVVGFPSGIPSIPLNLPLLKSCDICGVFWGAFSRTFPNKNRANVARLFALWDEGRISPKITSTYSMDEAGDAIAALASRNVIGKVVVTID